MADDAPPEPSGAPGVRIGFLGPEGTFIWIDMSMAISRLMWCGPSTPRATEHFSPVWYWNRSTVWQAWCHSRWSVHERGWPAALMLVRRKK